MRIKQIEIQGLFGMFNHIIPLNSKEQITIIYGINGIGKTMLFKILDSFFNSHFFNLVRFPFEKLIIEFDNEEKITLNNSDNKFIVKYKTKDKTDSFDLSEFKTSKLFDDIRIIRNIENMFPVERISQNELIFKLTKEVLTIEELIFKYPSLFPDDIINGFNKFDSTKIKKLISKSKIYFIQTQRLMLFNYFTKNIQFLNSEIKSDQELNIIDTVQQYSKELSELIQEKHREYAKKSEEYELSLGKRLRSKEIKTDFTIEELKEENKKLEEKRNELKSVGLFEDFNEESSNIPDVMDDDIERAVLSVNVQDMKNKLKIFDDISNKLKIFLDVLNNKRFSFKKITINPKSGFVFTNDNGKVLKVTELSSGEQHEIVLFYDLLFKVSENSLVLIDEPEISLHVVWQKEFLVDLAEIVKIRKFDILIATHSPTIINGNWDLTVKLIKEKNDEK